MHQTYHVGHAQTAQLRKNAGLIEDLGRSLSVRFDAAKKA